MGPKDPITTANEVKINSSRHAQSVGDDLYSRCLWYVLFSKTAAASLPIEKAVDVLSKTFVVC